MMIYRNCVKCGKEIEADFLICPYCGEKQPTPSATATGQGCNTQDNHIENHYNRDTSTHDNRDMSVHNTSNVTNHTTTNEIHIHGGAEPDKMTPQEQEEVYANEREALVMILRQATDETVFIMANDKINTEEKLRNISRREAGIRRKLVLQYKEEYARKQQISSTNVRLSPTSDRYMSGESARGIAQNVRIEPAHSTLPPNDPKKKDKDGPLKKCVIFVVMVVLLIWGLRSCIGCGSSKEKPEENTIRREVVKDSAEVPENKSVRQKSKKKTIRENKSTAPNPSKSIDGATSKATDNQKNQDESSSTSTMSPSELLAGGTEAIQKMDYDKASRLLKQAADKGSTEAYYQLGLLYSNNNFDYADRQTAINYFTTAAREGNANAMYELGNLYNGRDNDKAKAWYEEAAAHGHQKAASRLQ